MKLNLIKQCLFLILCYTVFQILEIVKKSTFVSLVSFIENRFVGKVSAVSVHDRGLLFRFKHQK